MKLSQENQEKMTPLKAIREKCVDCCGDNKYEVKLCPASKCPLHPFRFGKNPFAKHKDLSEEQKKLLGDRLRNLRNVN